MKKGSLKDVLTLSDGEFFANIYTPFSQLTGSIEP